MTMWVFGYGSLLWNPGFPVAERALASLEGYARSFCMLSIHYRGTEEAPGLVLALDAVPGALCRGVALRVADGAEDDTLIYLRERELISSAYVEKQVALHLDDDRRVEAVTYVIDPSHRQYSGGMALEEQAQIIAAAHGQNGPNSEYLFNTTDHLAELRLPDSDLDWLAARVRAILG